MRIKDFVTKAFNRRFLFSFHVDAKFTGPIMIEREENIMFKKKFEKRNSIVVVVNNEEYFGVLKSVMLRTCLKHIHSTLYGCGEGRYVAELCFEEYKYYLRFMKILQEKGFTLKQESDIGIIHTMIKLNEESE